MSVEFYYSSRTMCCSPLWVVSFDLTYYYKDTSTGRGNRGDVCYLPPTTWVPGNAFQKFYSWKWKRFVPFTRSNPMASQLQLPLTFFFFFLLHCPIWSLKIRYCFIIIYPSFEYIKNWYFFSHWWRAPWQKW